MENWKYYNEQLYILNQILPHCSRRIEWYITTKSMLCPGSVTKNYKKPPDTILQLSTTINVSKQAIMAIDINGTIGLKILTG